tara:strand:+ start:284 stop:436 length:153 start_codon:yes stop_codon:yes gene_type:complete
MTYTKTQIINGIKETFNNAKFHTTTDGDLTMSLDGKFVDHKWNKGTFINK